MRAPKNASFRPTLGAVSSASRVEGEGHDGPPVLDAEYEIRSEPVAVNAAVAPVNTVPTKSWWSGLSLLQKVCLGAVGGLGGLGALLWWIDPPGAKRNAPEEEEPDEDEADLDEEDLANDDEPDESADLDDDDSAEDESVLDGVGEDDLEEVESTDPGLEDAEDEDGD